MHLSSFALYHTIEYYIKILAPINKIKIFTTTTAIQNILSNIFDQYSQKRFHNFISLPSYVLSKVKNHMFILLLKTNPLLFQDLQFRFQLFESFHYSI